MRLGTGRGGRRKRATVAAAVGVAVTVLAAVPPGMANAAGDTTSTTHGPAATILTVPANQTKILQIDPAPTTPTTAAANPTTAATATPTTPTPAAPAAVSVPSPAATAVTVSADSPGLEALVATSAADRRRLHDDTDRADADLASLRSSFDAAQRELSAREGAEQEARLHVDQATADVNTAERRLADAAAAAADAAAVVGGATRTPVASPPSRGHTPRDAAAQAREAVVSATQARDAARAVLIDRTHDLDAASDATAAAGADLTARADDLQRGLDAADQAHQELAAADAPVTAGPSAAGPGSVTLRPAPTALARATIPTDYLVLYGRAAATCPGLPWLVLAAIGSVESAHGQSDAPGVHQGTNVAGAMGPMQFLAGTWAAYRVDGDGDGTADVYDPADAIFGAANYLCATGGGDLSTLRCALWDYNHADWYVEEVLQLAARY